MSRLAGYLLQHYKECDVVLDIGSGLVCDVLHCYTDFLSSVCVAKYAVADVTQKIHIS